MKLKSSVIYDSGAARNPVISELQELVRYRFLVWNLIMKDLKIRYKRSSIGFLWAMLNPLLTMAIQVLVFQQLFKFSLPHFAVSLLSGNLLWNLYAQGTNASMSGIQGNGHILRKLYLPPSVFVVSAIGSALTNFVFALGPLLLLAILDGLLPNLIWLYLIVPTLMTVVFTLGLGLVVASLIVFFTDTFEIYQVALQVFYFLTPIFYPLSILPEPLRSWEQYNPMNVFLLNFRDVLILNTFPSLQQTLLGSVLSLGMLALGWVIFTHEQHRFANRF